MTHLKGTEAVAELDDVHETVEVVRGEDEAVALLDGAPAAQHEVACQAVLEGPCEMLVEDGVEIVVVSSRVSHLQQRDRGILTDPLIKCQCAYCSLKLSEISLFTSIDKINPNVSLTSN